MLAHQKPHGRVRSPRVSKGWPHHLKLSTVHRALPHGRASDTKSPNHVLRRDDGSGCSKPFDVFRSQPINISSSPYELLIGLGAGATRTSRPRRKPARIAASSRAGSITLVWMNSVVFTTRSCVVSMARLTS